MIGRGVALLLAALLSAGCLRAAPEAEAVVNGQAILQEDFYAALKLSRGQHTLLRLIFQQLIFQEAERYKVSLDSKALQASVQEADQIQDPSIRRVFLRELEAQALMQRLLLREIPEIRIQQLLGQFRKELTQYEVSAMTVRSLADGQRALDGLQRGENFEDLARELASDPATALNGGRLGWVTEGQLFERYGRQAAESLAQISPRGAGGPFALGRVFVVVHLRGVRSDDATLRPVLESQLVESRRTAFAYRLFRQANITSKYQIRPETLPSSPILDRIIPGALLVQPVTSPADLTATGLPQPVQPVVIPAAPLDRVRPESDVLRPK